MSSRTFATALLFSTAAALADPGLARGAECPLLMARTPSSVHADTDRGGAKISVRTTEDVTLEILLAGLGDAEHLLELRFLLPTGELFERIEVPIARPGTSPRELAAGRVLPGHPHPVPQHAAEPLEVEGKPYARLRVPFPIAGTAIVHNSLYGRWTVEAYLDGAERPCGPALPLQIGR
ncbi:MAG: hypothetical protein M5U13_05345 [Thermoanaerobaculia bacterium]|nr:hypothetical protein [Thermoanaerobaculia bacterium]